MKYFYDTEFIEDGKTIDLISIGIVAEDGREYYAQNINCNFNLASQWVKDNVLEKLPGLARIVEGDKEIWSKYVNNAAANWWSLEFIAGQIVNFVNPSLYGKAELWGYYSAYDHVALMQIYGPMIDKPKGLPMYTMDIKQLCKSLGDPELPAQGKGEHHALADARWNKQAYEFLTDLAKRHNSYK